MGEDSLLGVTSSKNSTKTGKAYETVHWSSLMFQQFFAVVVKRCYYVRRNWRALFSQILLPALFVCVAMTVALTAPQVYHTRPDLLTYSHTHHTYHNAAPTSTCLLTYLPTGYLSELRCADVLG